MLTARIKNVLATQAIEKIVPSKDAIKMCEKISKHKISGNDAIAEIKKKYGITTRN